MIAGNKFMIIKDSFDNKGFDYCVCDDRCWPGLTAPTPNEYLQREEICWGKLIKGWCYGKGGLKRCA